MTSFSTGRAGRPNERTIKMMGTHLHRCTECGELSYDPRTGLCDSVPEVRGFFLRFASTLRRLA